MKQFILSNFFLGIIISISLCNCHTQDPLKFFLAAGIGTLLLVSLVVLRIYLASLLPFRSFFNLNFILGCKDNCVLLHRYRDGVMLVIGYSLLLYHMKKLAGTMGKCGLSHPRCVQKFFQ